MFDLGLEKKSEQVTVQGKTLTLYEPSALDRTIHLEKVMQRAEQNKDLPKGEAVKDAPGHMIMKLNKADHTEGLALIALCLAADPKCQASQDEIQAYLGKTLSDASIEKLYPVANRLAYTPAPAGEDIPDPNGDPAGDSPTS